MICTNICAPTLYDDFHRHLKDKLKVQVHKLFCQNLNVAFQQKKNPQGNIKSKWARAVARVTQQCRN